MSPDDNRGPLLKLLQEYAIRYPDEHVMVSRYQAFVTEHANCFERSLEVGHVTGSALVLDQAAERVLLTHHMKLDRWLQPGGHADGDPDVAAVAKREAEEESGLSNIAFFIDELLDVDIHPIPARRDEPAHEHFDCRFLLQAVGSDEYTVSDESHDLVWVPVDKVRQYTDDESIHRMVGKANQVIRHPER